MISYIIPENIDTRVYDKAITILNSGGIIATPTDTNFSIFCSIYSKAGINKLKKLKGDSLTFTFTLFCSSISQISEYADLDNRNFKIIKHNTPGPFVFILPSMPVVWKKIDMKRKEIGVRIPNNKIIMGLLEKYESPLFGITAAKQMANSHWWDKIFADENLFEFGWELEDIESLEMIIDNNDGEPQSKILSTVVDLTGDEAIVLRQGIKQFHQA